MKRQLTYHGIPLEWDDATTKLVHYKRVWTVSFPYTSGDQECTGSALFTTQEAAEAWVKGAPIVLGKICSITSDIIAITEDGGRT